MFKGTENIRKIIDILRAIEKPFIEYTIESIELKKPKLFKWLNKLQIFLSHEFFMNENCRTNNVWWKQIKLNMEMEWLMLKNKWTLWLSQCFLNEVDTKIMVMTNSLCQIDSIMTL